MVPGLQSVSELRQVQAEPQPGGPGFNTSKFPYVRAHTFQRRLLKNFRVSSAILKLQNVSPTSASQQGCISTNAAPDRLKSPRTPPTLITVCSGLLLRTKTERLRRSLFPQAIRHLNTDMSTTPIP